MEVKALGEGVIQLREIVWDLVVADVLVLGVLPPLLF